LKKGKKELQIPARLNPVAVGEVVGEAQREPGRILAVFRTSDSITSGREPFDDEVEYYN